jgi:uncharacterized protein (DUF362 family)
MSDSLTVPLERTLSDEHSATLVAVVRSSRPDYGNLTCPEAAPELPTRAVSNVAQAAVRNLFREWRLDESRLGTAQWNPLSQVIKPGSRVVIKPNWVMHQNKSGEGLECLVTHPSVLAAALDYVCLARPSSVVIGDAPVQGCDFRSLRLALELDSLIDQRYDRAIDISIEDFRRTTLDESTFRKKEDVRPASDFVLFDLKSDSMLEPVSNGASDFRITMYPPDALRKTHGPGRHQYLISRRVMEADVVVNMPKLKSHKKAGMTGALKNLVGINGNKEFLPHHRKGGESRGGDCYPGDSVLRRLAEGMVDFANAQDHPGLRRAFLRFASTSLRFTGDQNLEGSWYGNDTVWRMCLDLNRILLYGDVNGALSTTQRRSVIHITDAIVGGQGEGPLAPTAIKSGFLTGAMNAASADWANTLLMGFDPVKMPLVFNAFKIGRFPIACFAPENISIGYDGSRHSPESIRARRFLPFRAAAGWAGHCELSEI